MNIVRESIIYDDDYYASVLCSAVHEGAGWGSSLSVIFKIRDKRGAIKKLLSKVNSTQNVELRKRLISALIALYIVSSSTEKPSKLARKIGDLDNKHSIERAAKDLAQKSKVNMKNLTNELKTIGVKGDSDDFKDPQTLSLSDEGLNLIKKHEKCRLRAYDSHDGKITIGWGHAEPKSSSRLKVGDEITQEQADALFRRDLDVAERGVKRMFRQWKEYRGHDVRVTQGMYDTLVSLAYNMGIRGLRNTDFVEHLEREDYETAAKELLKTGVSQPGLKKRRSDEFELFTKNAEGLLSSSGELT